MSCDALSGLHSKKEASHRIIEGPTTKITLPSTNSQRHREEIRRSFRLSPSYPMTSTEHPSAFNHNTKSSSRSTSPLFLIL